MYLDIMKNWSWRVKLLDIESIYNTQSTISDLANPKGV